MASTSDEDDELLGIGKPVFSCRSAKDASRKESKMFSFLDLCVAEETERSSNRVKIQKLMKEEVLSSVNNAHTSNTSHDMAHVKEDNYWDRIRQETAKSTTSAKARRKRQLDDAIDGIVSCNENSNDEEYWKDRAILIGKASALTTALSTSLGVRKVFHRERRNVTSDLMEKMTHFLPFASRAEAVKSMETILSSIGQKNRSEKSKFSSLVGAIRASILSQNLSNLLMGSTIARWSVKHKVKVPLLIQKWLWRVLCSSDVESAEGSRLTLTGIFCSTMTDGSGCCSGGYGVLQMEHLHLMMKYIFGFRTKATEETPRNQKLPTLLTCGGVRLPPVLDVWCAAFENDAVLLPPIYDDQNNKTHIDHFSDAATELLSSLILASIDSSFHTGTGGLKPLQQLITAVVNTVQNRLSKVEVTIVDTVISENFKEPPNKFEVWITNLVNNVLEQARDLTEGERGSADVDDSKGCLPLCLMAKSMTTARLRATLSETILNHYCCGDFTNWSHRRKLVVAARCNELQLSQHNVPLSWKVLASAELGLASVEQLLTTCDGPQLYAIIATAKVCAEAGRALCAGSSCDGGAYGTKNDAAYACLSFEALENHCIKIKKKITCVFANQHLRRAKELLTQISIYSKHMKVEAMKVSGKRLKVQKTLESWIDCEDEEESSQALQG